jgi:hypothetical protein
MVLPYSYHDTDERRYYTVAEDPEGDDTQGYLFMFCKKWIWHYISDTFAQKCPPEDGDDERDTDEEEIRHKF